MKTKLVTVWHLEYALFMSDKWYPHVVVCQSHKEAAESAAWKAGVPHYACVKIVGPFQQEMPV